jgi:predicted RNase H-like HicB family nuclease
VILPTIKTLTLCDAVLSMTNLKISLSVVVEPDGRSFHAYCPGLKGLHVDGGTESEALTNAVEAARLYIMSMVQRDEPLPIGEDFSAERSISLGSRSKAHSKKIEMRWPTLQTCGIS